MHPSPSIAVVGATGAVGREFLGLLAARRFPHREVRLLASPRSAGTKVQHGGRTLTVEELGERSFDGVDLAFFSAGSGPSKQYAPLAVKAGATVIDNSSAFRMAPGVPLVVPEVNPHHLDAVRGTPAIIANPNCSTIIMLVAVTPLRKAFGLERVVVSTYQAASGAGAAAMEELREQTRAALAGEDRAPRIFPEPYAFNLFSHNTAVDPVTGRNVEEEKMIAETRKMWDDPAARIAPTCIRVATMRAHAESITVTLSRPATEAQVRDVLARAPGLKVMDDRAGNRFPTPLKASGIDETLVGRIRPDDSQEGSGEGAGRRWQGFSLFAVGDQILKGAALNGIQIAEMLLKH